MARVLNDQIKMNIVGEKVKYYRMKRHMSQRELSERLEMFAIYVCRGSISRIEDGSRTVTDIELYGISKVFNITIQKLFEEF